MHDITLWIALGDNSTRPSIPYPFPKALKLEFLEEDMGLFKEKGVWHITKPHRLIFCPLPRSPYENKDNVTRGNELWDFNEFKTPTENFPNNDRLVAPQISWPYTMPRQLITVPFMRDIGAWVYKYPRPEEGFLDVKPDPFFRDHPNFFKQGR